jgi:hypothetical protein
MGQYYKPCLLDNSNDIIGWAYSHDYDNGLKLMEHSYVGNYFVAVIEKQLYKKAQRLVWAGDYGDTGHYERVEDDTRINDHSYISRSKFKYILNHDRQEFCRIPEETGDLVIHPLPILTADGNGLGSGDYRASSEYVGVWAGHELEIVSKKPGREYSEIIPTF